MVGVQEMCRLFMFGCESAKLVSGLTSFLVICNQNVWAFRGCSESHNWFNTPFTFPNISSLKCLSCIAALSSLLSSILSWLSFLFVLLNILHSVASPNYTLIVWSCNIIQQLMKNFILSLLFRIHIADQNIKAGFDVI